MTQKRVALVTGAGTGIGKSAALALLKDGYHVALVGRRKDLLEKTAAESGANLAASRDSLSKTTVSAPIGRSCGTTRLIGPVTSPFGAMVSPAEGSTGVAPGVS